MKNNTIKGATGTAQGTNKSMMSKNMSSPLIFPNKRNDKDTILEKCEMISIGNMKGASHFTGPAK